MIDVRGMVPDGWSEDVRAFWFSEIDAEAWFKRDADLDQRIVSRFGALHDSVAALPLPTLTQDAATSLAAILVLDQFSRNMFRDSPRAFATDARALAIARHVITQGSHRDLNRDEQLFVYLPFEHSENAADQETSVRLISMLGDANYTQFAIAHRDIIARFGRFPHRNRVLGRASTPAERKFLVMPGSSF